MSNHANFTQNRQQTAELRSLSNKMTSHSTSVDALKTLQTKTFTNGSDPSETLSSATEKQFSVVGGVDKSTSSFQKINPIKVDDNGLLECKMIGNTSADGTGTQHNLHVDSNGNARVSLVSSVNILPADALNGDTQNDPANSVATSLKGRTSINDASSSLFLLSDSSGRLQVSVPQTSGVKLEDLSSTIDADHVNNSRSLPMTVKARQTIGDHTTGTYLKCNSSGLLEILRDSSLTFSRRTNVTINANTGDTTQDLGNDGADGKVNDLHIYIKASSAPSNLYAQVSNDNTNFQFKTGITFVSLNGGGVSGHIANVHIQNPPRYFRIFNNDGVSSSGTLDEIVYRAVVN